MRIISQRVAPSECRLLGIGHGGKDRTADRANDRQDHDRQDQSCDEVVGTSDAACRHERDEVEGVDEPLLNWFQLRDQE